MVNHYNVQRVIDVDTGVEGRDLGSASAAVQRAIDSIGELPRGTRITIRGQSDAMHESFASLRLGIVLAIVLVYLLMVANFQSWLEPLVIMLAVPGALAGVLWMLALTGTTINVESLMGAVMAVGVGVANGNLVVIFANELREQGYTPDRRRDRSGAHPSAAGIDDGAGDGPRDAADGAGVGRGRRAERTVGARGDRRPAGGDDDDAVRGARGVLDFQRPLQGQTSARRGTRSGDAAERLSDRINSKMETDPKNYALKAPGRVFYAGWIVAVVLLLVVTVGLVRARGVLLEEQGTQLDHEIAQGTRVLVAPVGHGEGSRTVQIPATLRGYVETPVYAKIAGYLKSISVDKGDRVPQGPGDRGAGIARTRSTGGERACDL